MTDPSAPHNPNWCPGCGNIGIWGAFKQAAVKETWDSTNTVLVAGVGCHGHIVNFIKITSFEGLHGRALPVAEGIKSANSKLNVFVFTGDGDCLGEGGNHFIHAARRNHNITVLLHNNSLYALTTGQASPLSPQGLKTKSTPNGNEQEAFAPLALAITAGATFVARAYSGDIPNLTDMIIAANAHQGFSVIEILQPCVTFNHTCSHQFYRERIVYLADLDVKHDISDKQAALNLSMDELNGKIPLGVIYKTSREVFEKPANNNKPKLDDFFKNYC